MGKGRKMSNSDVCVLLFGIAVLSVALRGSSSGPAPQEAGARSAPAVAVAAKKLPASVKSSQTSVDDGDTVKLRGYDGPPVRLLQVNAPELGECGGRAAHRRLRTLVRRSGDITVRRDHKLNSDRYGRSLVYLLDDKRNINVRLVREGHARAYFIGGERGDYARDIVRAERAARSHRRGIWACR